MTKERLRSYRALKAERDKLARDIAGLEASLYGPTGQKLDGLPRANGGTNYNMEALLDKKSKLENLYFDKVTELTEEMESIERAIEWLEPRERTLLRLYYISGLTWEQVAEEMNYSWRQVHNIHGKALEKLKGYTQ